MKRFFHLSTQTPREASAEFRIGLGSLPHLADHGFQNMAVLPGTFQIGMALSVDRELHKRVSRRVRNVTFHRPILVSQADELVTVHATDCGGGGISYTLREAGAADGSARPSARHTATRLEIGPDSASSPRSVTDPISIESFKARSCAVVDSVQFYGRLRENGNEYGPSFQCVSSIWRAGDQCLGKLSVPVPNGDAICQLLHPSLLDALIQLLTPFTLEEGKTFVLRSIERVEAADVDVPAVLWGHAVLTRRGEADGDSFVGAVRAVDPSGRPLLELAGVSFVLLDGIQTLHEETRALTPPKRETRPRTPPGETAGGGTGLKLVIASNFTAEPVEDSLNFWAAQFDAPIHVEFASHNQVFQELLGSGSAFRKNDSGVNAILLCLEEWAASDRTPLDSAGPGGQREVGAPGLERMEQCFGNRPSCVLPNGLKIVHLNQYETDYLYGEIFERQCYLKHGIRLSDGATVVDIGANIGLFSLFVLTQCENPKIYAFEPAPIVYDLLLANCGAHGPNIWAVNAGVSDKPGAAPFTFYEKSSVFSGFHSDESEDRAAIETVVRNMLRDASATGESLDEFVGKFTSDRLRRTTHECRLTTVSDILRTFRIDRIDLLKIDAEKSEHDILTGIQDSDWPKIGQIVIEIHDRTGGQARRIEALLSEKGYRCRVEHERLLESSGLSNLYAIRYEYAEEDGAGFSRIERAAASASHARPTERRLRQTVEEFTSALTSFANQSPAPLIVCVCPRRPSADADSDLARALNAAEEILLAKVGELANARLVSSESLLSRYPVKDYFDPESLRLGRIPYTPECYAVIGTALARALYAMKRSPSKVIVLDCDNTLWNGACGEDGPRGIEVTAPYLALQEFMLGRLGAGMLLCLCSKNNEKDVLDVFDQRSDLILKREHLVSWRINWNPKSANIKSLADELNVGLDSFIFIDDNPVECEEVRIHCPGVVALQLPENPESFRSFLDHIWAFDHAGPTAEDQKRTRLYQDNAKRRRFRERASSLKDFIQGLDLRIDMEEAADEQVARVSQLTIRANQFNFTTIRRSEKEIQDVRNREDFKCLAVRVADRFGDYGLAGVVIYEARADRYRLDTFLLSCRVLGRGVEHRVVSQIARRAIADGKPLLEFTYQPTVKNRPAREFLACIGRPHRNETGASWIFPAERLARLEYNPDNMPPTGGEPAPAIGPNESARHRGWSFDAGHSRLSQRIADELRDSGRLAKAIAEFQSGNAAPQAPTDLTPGNTVQSALLNIWRKVLGRPEIGLNDNFFEAGGTSLKAVQLISLIKRELKHSLSIVSLFESPTVTLLAGKLSSESMEPPIETAAAKAAQRGRQRRTRITTRKAA